MSSHARACSSPLLRTVARRYQRHLPLLPRPGCTLVTPLRPDRRSQHSSKSRRDYDVHPLGVLRLALPTRSAPILRYRSGQLTDRWEHRSIDWFGWVSHENRWEHRSIDWFGWVSHENSHYQLIRISRSQFHWLVVFNCLRHLVFYRFAHFVPHFVAA